MAVNPNIKFIYFDVGGVLLEFAHIREDVPRDWGVDVAVFQQCLRMFDDTRNSGEISSQQIEDELIKRFGDRVPVGYWATAQFVERFRAIQPMHEFVKELDGNYRLGLLTNVGHEVYQRTAKDFSYLYPPVRFEIKIASCEEGVIKPDSEIYRRAIMRANLPPEHILFIDDMPENVAAAKAMGMQALEFDTENPDESIAELRQLLFPPET